jgi:ribosomal-protein-alanine N-acetyltransferase
MRLLANASEAALLAQMHAECFSKAWSVESFVALLVQPGTFSWVADDSGFILVRAIEDESEILTLGVTPASRRRGVGSALVRAAMEEALTRGAKAMFLEVSQANYPAIALYKQLGFVQVGCRKGYYEVAGGLREDALVLRMELPPGRVGKCMQLG